MGKEAKEEVRIDKWMWSVRLFKTRTMAADACKKGRVMVGGSNVKASKMIRLNDIVQIKRPPITYSFKVLGLTENRMGAKLVPDFMECHHRRSIADPRIEQIQQYRQTRPRYRPSNQKGTP